MGSDRAQSIRFSLPRDRRWRQRPAGAALRQPQVGSRQCPRRPTKDNDVAWVYTRSGLPVEITAEFENWRRVRDSEGAEGWVYHSLLSGRRTAVVTMKIQGRARLTLDRDPDPTSAVAARLQASVVAQVKHCNGAGAA